MKCPKCGYLGFEHVDRCRNCGYDFSLLPSAVALPELPIRVDEQDASPLDDLLLIDAATAPPPDVPMTDIGADLENVLYPPASKSEKPSLPLFSVSAADDEPLITRASPPRPPLAVRRSTPEMTRPRAEPPRPQAFELSLDLDAPPAEPADSYTPAARAYDEEWPSPRSEQAELAAVGTRLVAVLIDLFILAAVDAVVVYFTMQICGLTAQEVWMLPKGPMFAFLLVQNGGYLVAFTAGGQTLGKMATGIRVIGTESAGALNLGRAFTRTAVWLILAIPAGLGFLTLLGRDHRGLHDRFAGTRVVRASA